VLRLVGHNDLVERLASALSDPLSVARQNCAHIAHFYANAKIEATLRELSQVDAGSAVQTECTQALTAITLKQQVLRLVSPAGS
jgi:hypothetical protein